ncbi:unnamed protein product [Allacma fusca]|uniref:Uncharacterized protein n=1 Tax=Allacma fusca TaxID=39272 RepID=A0A8J2NNI7_9HEXA|nr:unnamed protein product [Allacma fusca]
MRYLILIHTCDYHLPPVVVTNNSSNLSLGTLEEVVCVRPRENTWYGTSLIRAYSGGELFQALFQTISSQRSDPEFLLVIKVRKQERIGDEVVWRVKAS